MDGDWDAPALSHEGRFSAAGESSAPEVLREGRLLGNGGQGFVLAGHDRHLPREVAWKVARRDDDEARIRLRREAHILARLEHPGIVPIYDLVDDGRDVRMATRYIRGHTLRALSKRGGQVHEGRLLRHLLAVAHATAHAHERAIIHRDLKPENVMVGDHGETLVIDWGLAQIDGDTLSGTVGTPAYMSPEQARGERVGPAADVWALGVMLLEILGTPLWGDTPVADILERLRHARRPALPPLPREVAAIVARALEPSPEARYPHALAFAEDLEAYLDGRRVAAHTYSFGHRAWLFWKRHRVPFAVGLTTVIVVLIGLPILWSRISAEQDDAATARAEKLRIFLEAETVRTSSEHRAGRRAEAELAAARVLEHGESPIARGVIAAWAGVTRPRLLKHRPIPTGCSDADLSPAGDLFLCGRRDNLEVVRLEDAHIVRAIQRSYHDAALDQDALWLSYLELQTIERLPLDGGPATHVDACGRDLQVVEPGVLLDWDATCATVVRDGIVQRRLAGSSGQVPYRSPAPARSAADLRQGEQAKVQFQTASADRFFLVTLDTLGEVIVEALTENTPSFRHATSLVSPQSDWLVSTLTQDDLYVGSTRGEIARIGLMTGLLQKVEATAVRPVRRIRVSPEGDLLMVQVDQEATRLLSTAGLTSVLQLPGVASDAWFTSRGDLVTMGQGLDFRVAPHGNVAMFDGLIGVTSARIEGHDLVVTHHRSASVIDIRNGAVSNRFHNAQHVLKKAVRRGMELIVAHTSNAVDLHLDAERSDMIARPIAGTRRLEALPDGRLVAAGSGQISFVEDSEGGFVEVARERMLDLAVMGSMGVGLARVGSQLHVFDFAGAPVALTTLAGGNASAIGLFKGPLGTVIILVRPDLLEALSLDGAIERVWFAPDTVPTRVVAFERAGVPYVAAGTRSGEVLVWHWDGTLVARVPQHLEAVSSLSVGDRWLVSGAWDGRVRLFDLDVLQVDADDLVRDVRTGWGMQ